MNILNFVLVLFVSSWQLFSYSQTDTVKSFILPEMKILQKEKGKEVIYKFEEDANKMTLKDTVLIADTNIYKYKVNLSNISKISLRDGSYFGRGLLIGLISGIALGTLMTIFPGDEGSGGHPNIQLPRGIGYLLILPCMIIGGIFGAITPYYEEYSIAGIVNEQKKNKLIKILRSNKIE